MRTQMTLAVLTLATGLATAGPPTMEEAEELLQEQAWAEAAEAFAEIVEADPENGRAWHLRGYSVHADGRIEEALKIHRKTASFDDFRGIALYNIGCANALLGNREKAFAALASSAETGFDVAGNMGEDSDLRSLRGDPRFHALMNSGGGGRIFVTEVYDAVKIWTGERGDRAI